MYINIKFQILFYWNPSIDHTLEPSCECFIIVDTSLVETKGETTNILIIHNQFHFKTLDHHQRIYFSLADQFIGSKLSMSFWGGYKDQAFCYSIPRSLEGQTSCQQKHQEIAILGSIHCSGRQFINNTEHSSLAKSYQFGVSFERYSLQYMTIIKPDYSVKPTTSREQKKIGFAKLCLFKTFK